MSLFTSCIVPVSQLLDTQCGDVARSWKIALWGTLCRVSTVSRRCAVRRHFGDAASGASSLVVVSRRGAALPPL